MKGATGSKHFPAPLVSQSVSASTSACLIIRPSVCSPVAMAKSPTGVRDLLSRMVAIGEHLQQNGHATRAAVFHWQQQVQLDIVLQKTEVCDAIEPPIWFPSIQQSIQRFNRTAEREMFGSRSIAKDDIIKDLQMDVAYLTACVKKSNVWMAQLAETKRKADRKSQEMLDALLLEAQKLVKLREEYVLEAKAKYAEVIVCMRAAEDDTDKAKWQDIRAKFQAHCKESVSLLRARPPEPKPGKNGYQLKLLARTAHLRQEVHFVKNWKAWVGLPPEAHE